MSDSIGHWMKIVTALPTWALVQCILPFVEKEHPWYGRRFVLSDWAAGRTEMTKWFDTLLWLYLIIGAALVLS